METVLLPAYGRQYEFLYEVEKDLIDGKDFKLMQGPYCSIRDFSSMLSESVVITILYGLNLDQSYIIDKLEYDKIKPKNKPKGHMVRVNSEIYHELNCMMTGELNSYGKIIRMLINNYERSL